MTDGIPIGTDGKDPTINLGMDIWMTDPDAGISEAHGR